MKNRRRWIFAGSVVAAGLVLYGWAASAFSWSPDELGPGGAAPAPALAPGELRAVTFNAWRLSEPARVPGLVDALRTTAGALAESDRPLPELIAIQEIESRAAARALRRALEPTHEVTICECAEEPDGSLRSAVAIAADRRFFAQRSSRCIPLEREWPDHPRCAAAAVLEREGHTLHAVGVHLAWHIDNRGMAERLRSAVDADAREAPLLLFGDMNTWPGSESHRALTRAPLEDTCESSGPTHFTGNRLDYVLVNDGLRFVRGLDRRMSFETLAPSSSLIVPAACSAGRSPSCPVSDHLPEGAVLRLGAW